MGQRDVMIAKVAEAVPISCQACGGVLSQVKQWPPLRFRCQIGDAYTDEALAAEQDRPPTRQSAWPCGSSGSVWCSAKRWRKMRAAAGATQPLRVIINVQENCTNISKY